jgi:hypothetical protein
MCREWEVLGLVSQELERKAELPRTGNPAKGYCDSKRLTVVPLGMEDAVLDLWCDYPLLALLL